MVYSTQQLWQRLQKYYAESPVLGLLLDTSRMIFPYDFFLFMKPQMAKAFFEMPQLERSAIANRDEKPTLTDYCLVNRALSLIQHHRCPSLTTHIHNI
jgi:glucose-6-phosphate isomerase